MLAARSLAWGRAPGTEDARIQPEPAFLCLAPPPFQQSTARGWDSTGSSSPAGWSPSSVRARRYRTGGSAAAPFCAPAPNWERRGENRTRWFRLSCPSNPGRIGYICLRGRHRAGIPSKGPPRHRGHDSICALPGLREEPQDGAGHGGTTAPACTWGTALPQRRPHEQTGLYSSKHRENKPGGTQTEPARRQDHRHATLGTRSGPAAPPRSGCRSPGESPNGTLARGKTRLKPT